MMEIIGSASLSIKQGDLNIVFIEFLHYSETVFNYKSYYILHKFNYFQCNKNKQDDIQMLYNYIIHSNSIYIFLQY